MRYMRAYFDALNGISPPKELWEQLSEYFTEHYGDPGAFHQFGRFIKSAGEVANEQISKYFNKKDTAVSFCPVLPEIGGKILIPVGSDIWKSYAHTKNIQIEWVPMDGYEISIDKTKQLLENTQIGSVVIPFADDSTGTIQPVREIVYLCKEHEVLTICDISAIWGRSEIDFSNIPTDYFYLRGASWGAPLGLDLTVGSKTENSHYALIGIKIALDLMMKDLNNKILSMERLSNEFIELLNMHLLGVHLLRGKNYASGIMCLAFEDVDRQTIALSLDMQGIAVSILKDWDSTPEKLLAMGIEPKLADCAITMSVWHNTKEEELEYLLRALPPIIDRVRFEKKKSSSMRKS